MVSDKAQADVWAAGVIAYILLVGYPPFRGASTDEQFKLILSGEYKMDPKRGWGDISNEAKDFVQQLLIKSPDERWTTEQALAHPWILIQNDVHLDSTVAAMQDHLAQDMEDGLRAKLWDVASGRAALYDARCAQSGSKPNADVRVSLENSNSVLDLSGTIVSAQGLAPILSVLSEQGNPCVTLNLANTNLDETVMSALSDCLSVHQNITGVDISNNPKIGCTAGRCLLTLVQKNTRISSLNVDGIGLM
eukprot:gene17344-759_t